MNLDPQEVKATVALLAVAKAADAVIEAQRALLVAHRLGSASRAGKAIDKLGPAEEALAAAKKEAGL